MRWIGFVLFSFGFSFALRGVVPDGSAMWHVSIVVAVCCGLFWMIGLPVSGARP